MLRPRIVAAEPKRAGLTAADLADHAAAFDRLSPANKTDRLMVLARGGRSL